MSTLKVDALQDTSGKGFYPCRAWINFNGTGTIAIRDDENFSSITDNGTGWYSVTFSNNFANANYSSPTGAGDATRTAARIVNAHAGSVVSTSGYDLQSDDINSSTVDAEYLHSSSFGDL